MGKLRKWLEEPKPKVSQEIVEKLEKMEKKVFVSVILGMIVFIIIMTVATSITGMPISTTFSFIGGMMIGLGTMVGVLFGIGITHANIRDGWLEEEKKE